MYHRRSLRAATLLAVVAVLLSSFALISPARAGSTATLSTPLSEWLSTATDNASFKTIVTFHSRDGMSLLETMGINAATLQELPMAFATLTADQIRQLAAAPTVRSLWHDQRMDLYLDESVGLTKADRVWQAEGLGLPYTGAGVGVAVIDTGVDGLHPDLPAGSKVEAYALTGDPDLFDSGNAGPVAMAPTVTGDTYGHGTHVASTIGGLGVGATGADGDGDGDADKFVGMAPGSKIYSFKTDVGAFLAGSYILASFDWILAHDDDPDKNIRVSSNSWGCCDGADYNPDDPTNVATKALYDDGVTVVFAASNSGGPNTLNIYATSPWVVSVAAGTKNLTLASFSSRGRFDDEGGTVDINWDRRKAQSNNSGIYRPTITAPGEDIEAAKSSQAAVMAGGTDPANPLYTYASGTSMATPHVAGGIALMLEARPTLQPQHVIDILEGTADNLPAYELFEVGMGHLDALEAVQSAEKGKIHFPPSINGKTPQFELTGSTPIGGTVASGTWLVRECPDTTGQLSHHPIEVAAGTDAIYTEIEWADATQLIYLVLYDPSCNEAAASAALLDIGSVRHRALLVTAPVPGTWTVGVYGRLNIPTDYTGSFNTYDKR
ncbi:MAG TPA: S8 family serine peptidase [Acidimicrobiales bacterium]|nr:S8 family serine peptidase [Acidimicrobiales bacterium]